MSQPLLNLDLVSTRAFRAGERVRPSVTDAGDGILVPEYPKSFMPVGVAKRAIMRGQIVDFPVGGSNDTIRDLTEE